MSTPTLDSAGAGVDKLIVARDTTVKNALRQMDVAGKKILFVVDSERRLLGSLTDGDIRRWILRDGSLQEPVEGVYNRNPRTVQPDDSLGKIRELMISGKIEAVPRVDAAGTLTEVLLWTDLFGGEILPADRLDIPVLIMAGGKGQRLDPLTRILPKPLIPVGDRPIIELILEQFDACGCHEFFLTVNYKGKLIQSYFEHDDSRYRVKLVWEESYLGTAGSLSLAAPMIQSPRMFVSNCDILVRADYADIMNFHLQQGNAITVVGSMQHLAVPFGVLEMKSGGRLGSIREKQEYDFLANTGLYVIEKSVVDFVPSGVPLDFPDLLMMVAAAGQPVGIYPISQDSWVDVGQWQEYQGALKKLETHT